MFNTLSTLSAVNQAMRRVEGNVLDSKSVNIRQVARAYFELRSPYGILQILIFRFEKQIFHATGEISVCMHVWVFLCSCANVFGCLKVRDVRVMLPVPTKSCEI